ncbi:hypothetical protein BOTBODRAFT_28084 [Botryobasidium botryosum FD-172 SS1]|uniref:Fungal lipase-type domain-containing protein n=1 Tax=Botryobasidium botryosum (strain FD-172 SS1) TaxID=930990 RepID=A0A067MUS6_BOTB1|nr:hypothetical protein BOTBODRAFT_28084 [Botryobasidium botryosum FD-172 SS1]
MIKSLLFSLLAGAVALAAPALENRAGVTALSASQVSAYKPYAQFSAAAYCTNTASWNCGAACKALPGFVPYATGGDGNGTPRFFVGYWPSDDTAIVAHQGTDPSKLLSLLTDVDFIPVPLDSKLFPGMGGALVHNGFAGTQGITANAVLTAVKKIISERNVKKVTVVGHSLGGALALLDGAYLKLQLPAGIQIKVVTHGMPRVGNQWFADWIDANITDLSRITNMKDVIPIVPGRGIGFHHPSQEKHILSGTNWVACAGQDNTDTSCTTGAVPNIFAGSLGDHGGPYDGVSIGSSGCTA